VAAAHMSRSARAILAQTGLTIRALEILGVQSIEQTTAEKYADALVQADEEGAGKAYVDEIAKHAGVLTTSAVDESEAVHRSAVGYLRATGKQDYTADEYVAACNLVQSTKS
jgi:hypothetical protein